MYVLVCMCAWLHVCAWCVSVWGYTCVQVSVWACIVVVLLNRCEDMCGCFHICVGACMWVCVCLYVCRYLYACVVGCMSVILGVWLSVRVFVCICVWAVIYVCAWCM